MKLIFRIKYLYTSQTLDIHKYSLAYDIKYNYIDYFYSGEQVSLFKRSKSHWHPIRIEKL